MPSEEHLTERIWEEAAAITALCQRGHDIGRALQSAIEADAAEQVRRSIAAFEARVTSLRKEHKTSLAKYLAALQIPEAPSQAEWTSSTFRPYSERSNGGIETASLRLGTLVFNLHGRRIRIPLRLKLLNRCNLIILYEQDRRHQAVSILQSLLLRTLVTAVPGKMLLRCFDATEHGRAFSPFLQKLPAAITEDKAGFSPRDFDSLLTDLEGRVAAVMQKLLNATTPTLWDHNTATKGELNPYYALALDNLGQLDKDRTQRILRLMQDGPRAGLFTVITASNIEAIRECPAGREVLQSSLIVHVTQAGMKLEQGGASLNREFDLDIFPEGTVADTSLALITTLHKQLADGSVPFVLSPSDQWSNGDCLASIDIPIGRTKAGTDLNLLFNEEGLTGALVVGSSGYGKSNLLHVIITKLMLAHSPSSLNLYLLDLKGLEFNVYAKAGLPHVRMVLSEMNQKLGLAILKEFEGELTKRKRLLAAQRKQKLSEYNGIAAVQLLPRLVIVIDEFQKLFTGDTKMSRDAEAIITNLLKQGRSYGVHLIMASQNLSPQTTPRDLKTLFPIKILLKFNSPSDYATVLEESTDLTSDLTGRGQALYHAGTGALEWFRIPHLPFKHLEPILNQLHNTLEARGERSSEPVFLNGEEQSDVSRNTNLLNAIAHGGTGQDIPIWLGDAFSLTGTASVILRRQRGSNLLIACQERQLQSALHLTCLSILAALAHNNKTRCYLFQSRVPVVFPPVQTITSALPNRIRIVAEDDANTIHELAKAIKALDHSTPSEPALLVFPGLQKFDTLSAEFQNLYNRPVVRVPVSTPSVAESLLTILEKGPTVGFHSLVWIDSSSRLDRTALVHFNLRVGFRLTDTDFQALFPGDDLKALSDDLAVVWDRGESSSGQEFRPYSSIDPAWLDNQVATLRARDIPT